MDQESGACDDSRDAAQPRPPAGDGDTAPRLVIRGESSEQTNPIGGERWLAHDPDTGERCLVIPVFSLKRGGRVRLVPLPDNDAHPYAAITDWLNCTFPVSAISEDQHTLVLAVLALLGPQFAPIVERGKALHGYAKSFDLGESKAKFAFGGNAGTAFLSMSGESCAMIGDWERLKQTLEQKFKARITRWDGAVDDYLGVHSVDSALVEYGQGRFGTGGNKPTLNQHGNWACPDGRGRTLEVGRRQNGKMLRIYEKGMQLGYEFHPWVRWELELHNEGRIIPWDVLTNPGPYVAGAYPKALGWVREEKCRIPTIQKQMQIGYDVAVRWASLQQGPLLGLMRQVEGSDAAVLDKLVRSTLPRRVRHPAIDNIPDMLRK